MQLHPYSVSEFQGLLGTPGWYLTGILTCNNWLANYSTKTNLSNTLWYHCATNFQAVWWWIHGTASSLIGTKNNGTLVWMVKFRPCRDSGFKWVEGDWLELSRLQILIVAIIGETMLFLKDAVNSDKDVSDRYLFGIFKEKQSSCSLILQWWYWRMGFPKTIS